jgi:drug/metabolite transporter (DMT)-like permease
MNKPGVRAYGIMLVAVAAVLWSTAGLFVRALNMDVWTMLAWRSMFAALSLALVVLVKHGRRTWKGVRAIGWPGVMAIPMAAVSMGSYVVALKLTTVANVMVVYATVPFVAAGIAYFWLGERIGGRFLVASAVALVGIALMAGFATRPRDLAGNAMAFLMTIAFGVQLVMARRHPALDMAPVNAAGAALCAIICWPLTAAGIPDLHQLIVLALFGVTTTSLAYALFLTGGRHVPSGEAGLIGLLEVALAPLWVWFAFDEQPGRAAMVGGALVLVPVLWYLTVGQRSETASCSS